MTIRYDLHCHSTASDGVLSPTALVQRAAFQGVNVLALTDHDTTAGLEEALGTANAVGIQLISGIELSTSWQGQCFHVIGLNVNSTSPGLLEIIANVKEIRRERAEKIAAKLEKKHIYGALVAIKKIVGESLITRTHFANFLLSQHHVATQQEAFDRYLAKGKVAYISTSASAWVELEEAITAINAAGGIAVLAHPLRYQLSSNWLNRLLGAFKELGGAGIEVVTGRCNPDEIKLVADYAVRYQLRASVGSDFHSPENIWVELGRLAALPDTVKPVWELF